MNKARLEAFSDAIIAIIMTIMVLELKVPDGSHLLDLVSLRSTALCYLISFIYLAIFWINHHHLFQAVKHVNGKILLANVYLLFWLTLIPFVTAWSGENHFAIVPTILYGVVLLNCACAYLILTRCIIALHGNSSILAKALGKDYKALLSVFLYILAITIAKWFPTGAFGIYMFVAFMWLIPDPRIENELRLHQPLSKTNTD